MVREVKSPRSGREAEVTQDLSPVLSEPAPADVRTSGLLQLQRTAGNRAVLASLGAQARVDVGSATDPSELEADMIARQVLGILRQPKIQRPEDVVGPDQSVVSNVQRRAAIGAEGGTVDPDTESALNAARR